MTIKPALMMGAAMLSIVTAAAAAEPVFGAAPGLLRDRPLEEMSEWAAPGAATAIDANDYVDNYANDAGDAFFFAPGVAVNALDIAEPRIVIRGFAMGNRNQRSTVNVFRDGAPITDIHGDTHLAGVDLLSVSGVDVFRGGGGDFKFSGDNLGVIGGIDDETSCPQSYATVGTHVPPPAGAHSLPMTSTSAWIKHTSLSIIW